MKKLYGKNKERRRKRKELRKLKKELKKKKIKVSLLPKHTKKIISTLTENGMLTQKRLIETIKPENPRSLRYSIRRLVKKNVLIKRANFEDMRQNFFDVNPEAKKYLNMKYNIK